MASSSIVGARELKTRLGQYLNRVRQGETLLITDRNEPIAELQPVRASENPLTGSLQRLAAGGIVTLPARTVGARFTPIRLRAGSGAGAVSSDRDERG